MPRPKIHYPDKPWNPDPVKWAKVLQPGKDTPKQGIPDKPKGGSLLFDWRTLEDKPQE